MRRSSWQPAVVGFLTLCALVVAAELARRTGLIDASAARRASGLLLGLMAIVTGNFLPKMRPLGAPVAYVASVTAAERTAGWILVLMGFALAGLFAFAPLEVARSSSPIVALGGLALIAGDWMWVVRVSRSRATEAGRARLEAGVHGRTIAVWLLFAVAYVLVTASIKFLADDARWVRQAGSWSLVAFTGGYFLVSALLGKRRASR